MGGIGRGRLGQQRWLGPHAGSHRDERRARALRVGREVRKGRRTIGWVMMRCTLVAMVAEFHSMTVALSG